MTGLISVDPGVHFCAVAWFSPAGLLLAVEHRTAPLPAQGPTDDWRTVCEIPQVYDPRKAKQHRKPQDLIDLTVCAGRMTGGRKCEYVTPAQWKGQVPCTCSAKVGVADCTHHRRMINALDDTEVRTLADHVKPIEYSIRHNAYDAVSLGLVMLNRLTPAGVRGRTIGQR